jgi:hypothetical protein
MSVDASVDAQIEFKREIISEDRDTINGPSRLTASQDASLLQETDSTKRTLQSPRRESLKRAPSETLQLILPSKNSTAKKADPSQSITHLEKKKRLLEETGSELEEIEKIDNKIDNKRRELLKQYKYLKERDKKRRLLQAVDERCPDLLNEEQQNEMMALIPNYKMYMSDSELFLVTVSGPHFDEAPRMYKDVVCARSVSSYPFLEGIGRAGDPICDFYYIRLFEQATVVAVSDGCNWGEPPKQVKSILLFYFREPL